jgi:hypothetical protein
VRLKAATAVLAIEKSSYAWAFVWSFPLNSIQIKDNIGI